MDERRNQELYKLLGSKGTFHVLKYINQRGKTPYHELDQWTSTPTLNARLNQLLKFGLITHHLEKKAARREWYEITEKGGRILECMEDMVKAIEN